MTLTFSVGILIAAGCCLHTILCLGLMWTKILEKNWRRFWGRRTLGLNQGREDDVHIPIPGTNNVTQAIMQSINSRIGGFLSAVATLVFGGGGIALLIVGEINFFSKPLQYQTDPMASVGAYMLLFTSTLFFTPHFIYTDEFDFFLH